jgi:5-methyltetrahydropteroyltriglutamate--homocysteine methyltransferase
LDLMGTELYRVPVHRWTDPACLCLTGMADRRDRLLFAEAYGDPDSGVSTNRAGPGMRLPVCVGPVAYTGQAMIARDIAQFKAALAAAGAAEGFMTAIAPGSACRIGNEYYKTDEEFLFACADALREEYKAIVDAGLILQLDDPSLAENYDMINPEPPLDEYRQFAALRVDALNHAIRGLPEDRIRLHLCWGSWHGPHTTDIAMKDIVDVCWAPRSKRIRSRRATSATSTNGGSGGTRSCPRGKP